MPLSPTLLQECEDLIAANHSETVVSKLLAAKDDTGYKPDVLALSARWQKLENERINSTLSGEELSRRERSFDRDALRLLAAMNRELNGEKVKTGLLEQSRSLPAREFGFKTLVGGILVGSLFAAIGVYLFQYQPEIDCSDQLDLSGAWQISVDDGKTALQLGTVNFEHDACMPLFLLSGEVKPGSDGSDTDFSAHIGGIKDGEIQFIYENFDGERGVCRGVAPAAGSEKFTVHCVDLVGFDKDGQAKTTMVFSR